MGEKTLPKEFLDRYKKDRSITFTGIPIKKLSKKELRSIIEFLIDQNKELRTTHLENIEMMKSIYKTK